MLRSQELRQKRSQKQDRFQAILDAMAKEGRSKYNDTEAAEIAELRSDMEALDGQISDAEFIEKRQADAAKKEDAPKIAGGNPTGESEARDKTKIVADYRFLDAIRMLTNNETRTGLVAEMHQEAAEEARGFGKAVEGIAVPSFFTEQRDSTVGSAASAGNTVATNLQGFIGPLRPTPQVQRLGAQMLTGLTGNIEIPRQVSTMESSWEGETDDNAEDQPTFDKISLSPKRLGVMTEVSKQLLVQSSLGMENLLRNDMRVAQQLALDKASINGSGTSNQPEGILNTTGIGLVELGTNGAALTRTHLIALMNEVDIDDALVDAMAYLSPVQVRSHLMNTKLDAGSGRFIMENRNSGILGYNAAFSNQVPSNLTKGTGNDLKAIIFGDFRQLIIGQWGGLDLVADPYTKAQKAMVRIIVNAWYDTAVRQPSGFAVIKDAITNLAA